MMNQLTMFEPDTTEQVAALDKRRRSKPEMPQPPGKGPTKTKRKNDCVKIIAELRKCEEVSSLRLRELIPASLTQRISDLRKDGYRIHCSQTSGSTCGMYSLENPSHQGTKYP